MHILNSFVKNRISSSSLVMRIRRQTRSRKMFALVKFSDESYHVSKMKDVLTTNKQTTVRYKGSRFAANIVTTNEKEQDLLILKETLENENPNDRENEANVNLKNANPSDPKKNDVKETLKNENSNDGKNELEGKLEVKLKNETLNGEKNKAVPNTRTEELSPSKNCAEGGESENNRFSEEYPKYDVPEDKYAAHKLEDHVPFSHKRGIPIVVEDRPGNFYKFTNNNSPTKIWQLSQDCEIDTSLVATAKLLVNANQSMLDDQFVNYSNNSGLNDIQDENEGTILPTFYTNLESTPTANLDTYLDGKPNTSLEDVFGPSFSFRMIQEDEDEINVASLEKELEDSDIGSEYSPDADISGDSSDEENALPNTAKNNDSKKHADASKSFNDTSQRDSEHVINTVGHSAPDDEDMFVVTAESGTKRDYCLYCHTMQAKLSRHVARKHRDQKEVLEYLSYPVGSDERKKLMATIRKKSHFTFNTNRNLNTGERKVTRRPSQKSGKTAIDFATCPVCLGDYAKNSLRHHVRRCRKRSGGKRDVLINSKKITGRVHSEASNVLRHNIYPTMHEDAVVRAVRYDELITRFGNKLCQKYKDPHFYDMIRQKLRQLGRFIIEFRKHAKDIHEFSDVFLPKNYDATISAIQCLAGLNESQTGFHVPSLATSLGTLLKQVGSLCISEYIKKQNKEKQTLAEDYVKLLVEDYPTSISRTVLETNAQQIRQKKVTLPLIEDIRKLQSYLRSELEKNYALLEREFSISAWLNMGSCILVLLQLFNRRRPGETERILIKDFENYEKIDHTNIGEEYKKFSMKEKAATEKYVRFIIRGKLNRTVPILMHKDLIIYIQRLLSLRKLAKVADANPYLFGIPGRVGGHFKYLRSCELIRRYGVECGAAKPETLRATVLRKHVATVCAHINLTDGEVSDLANFMGHAEKIHRSHYRQPAIARDIVHVSKLLEIVQGRDFDYDSGSDSGEENTAGVPTVAHINKTKNHQSSLASAGLESTNQSFADSDVAPKKRRTRSLSPYGACKRVRWTEEEKNVILHEFQETIRAKKLPPLKDIQEVVNKHKILLKRNVASIKTWISNQIKKRIL